MSESKETTPNPTPDATVEDMPKIETAGALIGQEAIDAAWEAEQEKELKSLMEEADKADPAEDGGDNPPQDVDATPPPPADDGEPPAKETPPQPATPPDTGTPGTPANPPPDGDLEARLAQARLEGERAAAGRFGGEKQSMLQRIADLEARLASGAGAQPAAAKPSGKGADADADPSDEEIAQVLGDNWKEDWGEDAAKAEYRRQLRVARKVAGGLVNDAVREAISAERRDAAVARFEQELEAAIPGAMDMIGRHETNGLDAYLDAPFEGTSVSRRTIVNAAIDQVEGGATGDAWKRAFDTVSKALKGYADGRRGPSAPATPPAKTVDPAKYVTTAARGTAGAGGVRGGTQDGKRYRQADIEKYLDAAKAKGEAAFEAAQDWVCQQINAGRVVD